MLELAPDTLADDQALVINAEQGLILILGCAHRGIDQHPAPSQKSRAEGNPAGHRGCHLMKCLDGRLLKTVNALKGL